MSPYKSIYEWVMSHTWMSRAAYKNERGDRDVTP